MSSTVSKDKHTPGPWTAAKYKGRPTIYWERGNGTTAIASVYDMASAGDPDANARLIAAAPDLLAEVRDRSQALGGIKILLLQGDCAGAMEILDRYELVFTDGPIMTSPAIAKAEADGT